MIKFLRRILGDRRGNALMMAGLSLPLVVGAAGLGTDTVQWVVWKRELQRAADSAAFAGVYAKAQDNASMSAEQAVANDLDQNNHTMVTLLGGYPQVTFPAGPGWENPVRVTLAIKKELGFSGLFLSAAPTITATATAAMIDEGTYCVVALAETGPGLNIGGSANVNMGCGAIANSTDGSDAVSVDGTSHTFIADPVAAVGGIDGTINGSPNLDPYTVPMEDPYADLPTGVPPGTSCTNFNSHILSQTGPNGNGGQVSLEPGCYSTFTPGNHTYTLEPGTYYLDNTSLNLNGSTTIQGDGVTIVLTGSNPGTITVNGTSTIDLSAPTSGIYENMVLVQSPNASVGNNNTINGSNNSGLDGAVYFPNGDLTLTGTSAQAYQCAMIVGYTVSFTGNAAVQNNTGACTAATQVEHKRVRLVG